MRLATVAALLASGLLAVSPVRAHHSFASEHDGAAPVILKGEVIKVEWINPHVLLHMKVTEPGRSVQVWVVQGSTPRNFRLNGLNETTLKPGTEISVRGFQAKDKACVPACKAGGNDVTFADGTRLKLADTSAAAQAAGKAYNDKLGASPRAR